VLDDALKHVARFFDPTNIDEKNIFFFPQFHFFRVLGEPIFSDHIFRASDNDRTA
jgi:hypothetical protein